MRIAKTLGGTLRQTAKKRAAKAQQRSLASLGRNQRVHHGGTSHGGAPLVPCCNAKQAPIELNPAKGMCKAVESASVSPCLRGESFLSETLTNAEKSCSGNKNCDISTKARRKNAKEERNTSAQAQGHGVNNSSVSGHWRKLSSLLLIRGCLMGGLGLFQQLGRLLHRVEVGLVFHHRSQEPLGFGIPLLIERILCRLQPLAGGSFILGPSGCNQVGIIFALAGVPGAGEDPSSPRRRPRRGEQMG